MRRTATVRASLHGCGLCEDFARVPSLHCRRVVGVPAVHVWTLCGPVFKSTPGHGPGRDLSIFVASSADAGRAVRLTCTATNRRDLKALGIVRRNLGRIRNWQNRAIWSSFHHPWSSRCREAGCTGRRNRCARRFGDPGTILHIWATKFGGPEVLGELLWAIIWMFC